MTIVRICLLFAILTQVSACVFAPRFDLTDRIDFNYSQPAPIPMSYSDLLCCADCTA